MPQTAPQSKMVRVSDQYGDQQSGYAPGQQQPAVGGTSFSNIYVGQALAASSGATQTRYKGASGTSKVSINSNLGAASGNAPTQIFNDNRNSRPELIQQSGIQPLIKGEILENKLI